MNIRYLQSNFLKIPQDNLIKFLYDLILQDMNNVENHQEGQVYHKGDRVYLQENGKHQIFQCLVDNSSTTFRKDEWAYILEIYEGNVDKLYSMQLKEEVHYIEEYNRGSIYTNLEFNKSQSTVAVYCGKKRYVVNHDFTINGKNIVFNKLFNVGDRLILEVRELVGSMPEMVYIILYDLNKIPYKVGIDRFGNLSIEVFDGIPSEDAIKYGELVTGDRTYTLLVDGGSRPYELKAYRKIETYITGTNNEIFKVEGIENDLKLIDCSNDRTAYSDTKYVLGLDKKFYTLSVENGEIIATEAENTGLEIRNVELGVRYINDKFESKLICIDNGVVSIRPYIDNGGYHNINFIDKTTREIVRMSITDDNSLELNDGLDETGYSGTRLLEYFYFFDEEWTYNRMYVDNGLLYYEDCSLEVIPDSRGINLLRKDGEMAKLRVPHSDHGLHVVKCVSLDNLGTFESPIEGFVMNIEGITKLVTVNKEGTGFEIVNTNLPFRTNHHYVMSTDNKLYKLIVKDGEVEFLEGIDPGTPTIEYIDADGIYYYLMEGSGGEVELSMTDTLPEGATAGVLVNEYEDIKFRMIDLDGEPTFVKTDEEYENEYSHVVCVNNTDRMCFFSLNNEEFFYSLIQHEGFSYTDEYEIECVTVGAYIKSYEIITRFDIVNGECVLHPISTFVHRVKSDDGNVYVMDVVGDPYEEVLSFTHIDNVNFNTVVGSGNLYLQDVHGTKYIAHIDDRGMLDFEEGETGSFVDYNITSLVQSSQGLYKIIVEDENIKLEKMFDNMYESDVISYGNMVKKSLNVQLNDGTWYSFAANGLGEVIIKEADKIDATGLVLRSDDGFNYGLGMLNEQFVTYKSYISNPIVQERLYIRDSVTGLKHALFMSGNKLCSEETTDGSSATNYLIIHDAYKNEFKIEITNNVLSVSSL